MNVPLLELKTQYKNIKKEVDRAVAEVLSSGKYILGEKVRRFESEFARFCGANYAVGAASGTDALGLSLRALDIGKGDEVITTPFTFIATAEAIVSVGARPVFADIDPSTYNIDPERIEDILKKDKRHNVKAVIPVHLYGQPCDMDRIMALARRYRLKVIEDCAQAAGATYKGKKVGTFGDSGAFSFFPSKNLGGYGDGGVVVTNKKSVADRIRMLRFHGAKDKYHHTMQGINSRLDELQAAILRVKLKHIDKWNNARKKNALLYKRYFTGLHLDGKLGIPDENICARHIYHVYALRVKRRARMRRYLSGKGIATGMHYPLPVHLEEVYRYLGYKRGGFPNAEKAASEVISLPMYPELKEAQIRYVVSEIGRFFKNGRV